MARFENRNIVVTGAARGMGAEEARQLVQEGARVVLCDVLKQEGEQLARELGPKATFLFHDVTNEQHWNALAEHVHAAGGLDGLVNNAGIFNPQPISETTAESFNRHMQINQLGCFLGIKFADQTVGKNGASIVNISSLAGLRGPPGVIAYAGTKWAVRGMTKTAALELAPKKIRCNSVHPGLTKTKMIATLTDEYLEARVAGIPLKRAGTVQDVAKLVMFLLSDDASYITGAEVAIDGGSGL